MLQKDNKQVKGKVFKQLDGPVITATRTNLRAPNKSEVNQGPIGPSIDPQDTGIYPDGYYQDK